jgi:hypothetical protein
MARRFGFRHRTTGAYLGSHPDMGPHLEVPDRADAATWTEEEAKQHRAVLEDFAPCWQMVEIDVPMMSDFLRGQDG